MMTGMLGSGRGAAGLRFPCVDCRRRRPRTSSSSALRCASLPVDEALEVEPEPERCGRSWEGSAEAAAGSRLLRSVNAADSPRGCGRWYFGELGVSPSPVPVFVGGAGFAAARRFPSLVAVKASRAFAASASDTDTE